MDEVLLFRLKGAKVAVDLRRTGPDEFDLGVITPGGRVLLRFRGLTLPQALRRAADLTQEMAAPYASPEWVLER